MLDQTLVPLAVAITTLGGAWLTIKKIARDAAKTKKEQAAEVLHAAKEADAEIRLKLDAKIDNKIQALDNKIHALDAKVKNLEANVEKDLEHLRETYNGEIRNLGQKIEELRSELRSQHGQLVALLTKMIGERD